MSNSGFAVRLLVVMLLAVPGLAVAQPALGPRLQDATIHGHGNLLTIRRLPVQTANGVVYRDITIELHADAAGNILLAPQTVSSAPRPAAPTSQPLAATETPTPEPGVSRIIATPSTPEVEAHFIPGTYRSASGSLAQLFNTGNPIGAPFPSWTLNTLGDGPFGSASWYAGPIRSNPRRGLIEKAGISSELYSYGVVAGGAGSGGFDDGRLIGAIQQGNTLTIVSFYLRGCCTYSDSPVSSISYTLLGK